MQMPSMIFCAVYRSKSRKKQQPFCRLYKIKSNDFFLDNYRFYYIFFLFVPLIEVESVLSIKEHVSYNLKGVNGRMSY